MNSVHFQIDDKKVLRLRLQVETSACSKLEDAQVYEEELFIRIDYAAHSLTVFHVSESKQRHSGYARVS